MTDSFPLPPLVALVGPTAVGKTNVAISLATQFGAEIICADSRTLYRGMDIGTAKPTAGQRELVPHHLLDLIQPNQTFTLAEFQGYCYRTIADITSRGRVPLLVGGSGLYVKAIVEGFEIPRIEPDLGLRRGLEEEAALLGADHLYAELQRVDPRAAQRISPQNVRRIVRALEVYRRLGIPISQLQTKTPPPYRILIIGLTRSLESLHRAIVQRVDGMIAAGLVDEVRGLVQRGFGYDLPAMSGIGYHEIGMYLRGEIDLDAARELITRNTRRFVRRQYQWFHLSDPSIHWFDLDQPGAAEEIAHALVEFGLTPLYGAQQGV